MFSEKVDAVDATACAIARGPGVQEQVRAHGRYCVVIERPPEHQREDHNTFLFNAQRAEDLGDLELANALYQKAARLRVAGAPIEFDNVVTDEGARFALDKTFEASAYTATWYMGLIAGTGYSAVAAGDTAAQINGTNGWDEAGGGTSPTYTGARKTMTWNAASSRSKVSATISFTFTNASAATMKGVFLATTSTKDGTTGTLYSAGLSSGGDDVVKNGDVANVVWTGGM